MLENSFIRFYGTKQESCGFVKPISTGENFIIYPVVLASNHAIHLYDIDGNNWDSILSTRRINIDSINFIYLCDIVDDADELPDANTCMYVQYDYSYVAGAVYHRYSNTLVYMSDTEGLSMVEYRCNEDAFGFPFTSINTYLVSWLPINIKNPQLKQEDKTYVKRDGEVVVLMAKYYKEWEAESEYIPEGIHDRIVAALSCDYVYINGVRMTKSDSYQIDWDNTIKKACGQKLAKATWKMRANVTERNSNC